MPRFGDLRWEFDDKEFLNYLTKSVWGIGIRGGRDKSLRKVKIYVILQKHIIKDHSFINQEQRNKDNPDLGVLLNGSFIIIILLSL